MIIKNTKKKRFCKVLKMHLKNLCRTLRAFKYFQELILKNIYIQLPFSKIKRKENNNNKKYEKKTNPNVS